jgi:hypothetical protein
VVAHVDAAEDATEHLDLAGRGMQPQRGDPRQRCLAAAVRAEQDPAFVLPHLPVDAVEDDLTVPHEPHAVQAQDSVAL